MLSHILEPFAKELIIRGPRCRQPLGVNCCRGAERAPGCTCDNCTPSCLLLPWCPSYGDAQWSAKPSAGSQPRCAPTEQAGGKRSSEAALLKDRHEAWCHADTRLSATDHDGNFYQVNELKWLTPQRGRELCVFGVRDRPVCGQRHLKQTFLFSVEMCKS